MRIFVVEDHPDTLQYFTLYLESLGHEVCSAGSISGALAQIPGSGCDVLISDVGLQDGTGWELLERLRHQGMTHPPYAIAMSGFGRQVDRLRSEAAGFRHHLLKPFDPEKFEALLDEAARELRG